ncbi:DUF5689 domain-containing protein [Paenimyroides aestuarii]|uniref:DUF5689 domain-containing protein n=1 Tax=Paenimyroides aestuarii TaxID=2968490 RepID=A0ABY5NVA1_9FLAO|nr:DUF5689 domain-containing protein [Paenimyroides aestuarii]UUV22525.1 DUF5689 domain-containing protein [Paenimyroides aestuarii]
MKAIKYTFAALTVAALLTTAGCAHSDDVSAPEIKYHQATPTITLEELYAKANTTVQQYTEKDVLEAYVSSSDEGGTFYKSVSLQNLEGTKGFSISVDMYNISNDMAPGRKVYIYLEGMYFSIVHGSLVLGDLYEETSVGRMRPQDFYKKVFPSAEVVAEEDLLKSITLADLKSDNYINTLVEIDQVQFSDDAIGTTFYDPSNVLGGATNHLIEDASGSMIFRTSEFAKFASKVVPENNGKIRGVLTKFNSDYQFMARTFNDIQLNNPRVRPVTAIGGTSMVFTPTVNETFESFEVAATASTFPQYGNDYALGGRYWAVKSFQNNKYIQLTAFGNNASTTKSYFIVPVQFNGNNSLSFDTKDGYYNGNVLNVYYVPAANYTYGDYINTTNFTNITTQFTYSSGTTNGYAANFTPSGSYQFPSSVTGNGFIVFEYSGNTSVTSTIQIDNILFQ